MTVARGVPLEQALDSRFITYAAHDLLETSGRWKTARKTGRFSFFENEISPAAQSVCFHLLGKDQAHLVNGGEEVVVAHRMVFVFCSRHSTRRVSPRFTASGRLFRIDFATLLFIQRRTLRGAK